LNSSIEHHNVIFDYIETGKISTVLVIKSC